MRVSFLAIAIYLAASLVSAGAAQAQVDSAAVILYDLPGTLGCGQSYTASITMLNTGTSTWTRDLPGGGYKLGAVGDEDPFRADTRVWLPPGVTVEPGDFHVFEFTLTAPQTEGSYLTDWRMVREYVGWFGSTASRWVSVTCQGVDQSQVVTHDLPLVLSCGQTFEASVTMRNVGTTTWTRDLPGGGYKLGALGDSDPFTNQHRVWLPPGVTVPPGQNHTFNFTLTAPSNEGTYTTDWRMVREGVDWFGAIASRAVVVTCEDIDASQLVSVNLPTSMTCGETRAGSVRMRNIGTSTWTRAAGFKLGTVDDSDPFFNGTRVWLPSGVSVAPGQEHTFTFTLDAPVQEGTYVTDWRMVHEGVAWFGPVAARSVNVTCTETDDSQVVFADLPSNLGCGDSYTAQVRMLNTGTSTWTRAAGFKLGPVDDSDPFYSGARVQLPAGASVAPGQAHTFTFTLEAPTQGGTYVTDWRMVHEGVGWFGAVAASTVNVSCQQVDAAQLLSAVLPGSLACGESFNASVTLRNTGTTTWTRDLPGGGYKLGAVDDDDPFTTATRVWLPVGTTVAPGQQYTFNFSLTAPQTGGNYLTDWRMVREGVAFFGPTASSVVNVACQQTDDAVITSINLPSSLSCGQSHPASITALNTGTTTWTSGGGYGLKVPTGTDPFYPPSFVPLPPGTSVAPGQSYVFNFNLTAPVQDGSYVSRWRMFRTGGGFFGQQAVRTIDVTCPPSNDAAQVAASNLPGALACGASYGASVTMQNTGTTTWTRAAGYKLGAVDDEDPLFNGTRIWLPSGVSVAPGQSYTFSFTLTAPAQSGSYLTDWRMVREGVDWFGQTAARVVAVSCGQPNNSAVLTVGIPAAMDCGETAQGSVTLRNTGTTTWTRSAGYKLGAVGDSDPFYPGTRIQLPPGTSVPPGTDYTFLLPLEAPQQSGTYRTDWQMVQEGVGWFGGVASRDVVVSCGGTGADDAQVETFSLPSEVACGEAFTASLTLRNTGTSTWTPAGGYSVAPVGADPFYDGPPLPLQGSNVPPGASVTFNLPLRAPTSGGSASTSWRMTNGAGSGFGQIAQGSVNVQCTGGGEPVIDAISPDHVASGSVTVVHLTGQNFQGATVSIAHEPAEPGDPVPDYFPSVTVASINGAGTTMSVEVDATDPRVSGFYNLVVATNAGEMGTVFRVVPNAPDVDVWTPSEPVRGRVYNLLVSGVNLAGATVRATAPGLSVYGLTSTHDYVYGFLEVAPNAALGPAQYIVTGANGAQTAVNINVVASAAQAQKNDFNVTEEAAARAAQNGELVPAVYFQDLQIREDLAAPSTSTEANERGPFCFFSLGWDIYRWRYVLVIPFDPITGEIDTGVLDAIGLGQTIPAGIKIFSAFADFGVNFQFRCFPISHVQICIYGYIGFEIPGIGGQILAATGCFLGGQFIFAFNTTGILGNFSFGTATGGFCASVNQLTTPADGGSQRGDVTLNECCPDELTVTADGTAFAGTPYATPFEGFEVPVADITPEPASCPAPSCLHLGTPNDGSLTGDTSLVVGAGFYHFLGTDPAGTDDRGCEDWIHSHIQDVGAAWTGTRMGVGDLSTIGGGPFPPHASHENGLDVDVRYVRNDGVEGPLDFNTHPGRYDEDATQELIDLFIDQGATLILVDARANIVDPTGVVQTDGGHFNHFHVRFADPDGTAN